MKEELHKMAELFRPYVDIENFYSVEVVLNYHGAEPVMEYTLYGLPCASKTTYNAFGRGDSFEEALSEWKKDVEENRKRNGIVEGKKTKNEGLGALLITTTGKTTKVFPKNSTTFSESDIQKILGGAVNVVPLGEHYMMMVKKEITAVENVPNAIATEHYKKVGGEKPVLGDVIISDKVLLD